MFEIARQRYEVKGEALAILYPEAVQHALQTTGSKCKGTFEDRLQGLMIGMYCDVSFAKKQLIELLGGMNDSRGLFFSIYAYFCSMGFRELKL